MILVLVQKYLKKDWAERTVCTVQCTLLARLVTSTGTVRQVLKRQS